MQAVIDTQSVLDWQFFHNPACSAWTESLAAGQWQWIASLPMRDELAHVLLRGLDRRWTTPPEAVLEFFDKHVHLVDQPLAAPGQRLVCSDPDDQKFIDLALLHPARWLVSRDRAVLKLRRRAHLRRGLEIVAPAAWHPWAAAIEPT
jgi:predicted nucleic acid-binding protein